MTAPAMIDVARWWAEAGVYVFPAWEGGEGVKRPRVPNNLNAASIDLDTIERWWRLWPGALVAGVMGPRSDLACLDVDRHEGGADGFASLAAMEEEGFTIPAGALVVDTPNRGRHHLFRLHGRTVKTRNGIKPGVDLRGTGSYVILAGSQLADGRTYELISGGALARAA